MATSKDPIDAPNIATDTVKNQDVEANDTSIKDTDVNKVRHLLTRADP
jgi:hypothetical protein